MEDDEEEMLYQEMEEAYDTEDDMADEEEYIDQDEDLYGEEDEDQYEDPYEEDDYDNRPNEKKGTHESGHPSFIYVPLSSTPSPTHHYIEKGGYSPQKEEEPQQHSDGNTIVPVVLLLLSALLGYMACVA